MKKTKVSWNGKRLKDIYVGATKWQVFKYKVRRFMLGVLRLVIWAGIIFGIFTAGRYLYPAKVYTTQEVIKEIEMDAPILEKIAKAESLNSHYCLDEQIKAKMCSTGEKGQVLLGENGKTVDIGRYQINNYYWGAKATEMGLNLWVEEDNETMAKFIFKNYGSSPWDSSSVRWNK